MRRRKKRNSVRVKKESESESFVESKLENNFKKKLANINEVGKMAPLKIRVRSFGGRSTRAEVSLST